MVEVREAPQTAAPRRPGPVRVSIWILAVAFAHVAIGVVNPALAVSFEVNDRRDLVDANLGDGLCRTSSSTGSVCTLRAAIQQTNALPGADIIRVPAGTYELSIPPLNENAADTGDFDVTGPLTILGADADAAILDGGKPPGGAQ
jgi:large repetitive protein